MATRHLRYRKIKDSVFRTSATLATLFCFCVLCTFLFSVSKSAINALFIDEISTQAAIEYNLTQDTIEHRDGQWSIVQDSFIDNNPALVAELKNKDLIRTTVNTKFFTNGASSSPYESGIFAAICGSASVLILFLTVTIPLGVISGVCLSEFMKNKVFLAFMRINIQNLTSIPGIIYGLITLSFFINYLGLPRSSVITGAITISLLILPLMIILTYNAILSVQNEYRLAGFALGASKVQVAFRVVLPLAFSRVITSILLSIARATGETAPLIITGMAFFSTKPPTGVFDPATTLPLQIYLWILNPEKAFLQNAEFAIFIFILFIIFINTIAYILKGKRHNF